MFISLFGFFSFYGFFGPSEQAYFTPYTALQGKPCTLQLQGTPRTLRYGANGINFFGFFSLSGLFGFYGFLGGLAI
jgi:hypothetical protein